MPANTSFTSGQILTAAQMTALPWGVVNTTAGGTSSLSYRIITTAQTINAGNTTEITNSSITFVGIAGRLYRASFSGFFSNTSGSGAGTMQIVDGSAAIQAQWFVNQTNASGAGGMTCQSLFTATGSVTRAWRYASATGNCSISGATSASSVTIEDMGPSA